jgi:hypothetical protein
MGKDTALATRGGVAISIAGMKVASTRRNVVVTCDSHPPQASIRVNAIRRWLGLLGLRERASDDSGRGGVTTLASRFSSPILILNR